MTNQKLELAPDHIADFCRRYHIHRMAMFGSLLNTETKPGVDANILIEFEPGHVPGLAMVRMPNELSTLLGGCNIELETPNFINQRVRERVLTRANDIYNNGTVLNNHMPAPLLSIKLIVIGNEMEQAIEG
jgi:hypothetical protein